MNWKFFDFLFKAPCRIIKHVLFILPLGILNPS
jgi:hypothetical protein